MRRLTTPALVLAASLLMAGGGPATAQRNSSNPRTTLNSSDRTFMRQVDQANLAEVSAGQLAQQKATGANFKDFAQHMIDDHATAENDLKQLAQSKGVVLPTVPSAKDRTQASKLMKLNVAAFDSSYRKAQVDGHKQVIALFQHEIRDGRDSEVKEFAQKYLPKIVEHLHMAEALSGGTTQMHRSK